MKMVLVLALSFVLFACSQVSPETSFEEGMEEALPVEEVSMNEETPTVEVEMVEEIPEMEMVDQKTPTE
jgi:hypothetical protein